ncbi:MAG: ferritin family protein [Bacteroidia bacterium]|jgi:rubrerythrin|nr:ferritin family protein [Bacteroidia bacterium]
MFRKQDFSNLNLQDALDLAIIIEEEAKERYEEFARQIGSSYTGDAGNFFVTMAENEAKHCLELSNQRKKLFGLNPVVVNRFMIDEIRDVEAPDYDTVRSFMSPKKALEVALASEIKAYNFYEKVLKELRNTEVKKLFIELKEEEMHHQNLVKALIEKISGDLNPEVDPEDVDEPSGL